MAILAQHELLCFTFIEARLENKCHNCKNHATLHSKMATMAVLSNMNTSNNGKSLLGLSSVEPKLCWEYEFGEGALMRS